jgi:tripartite-type tricarboxylate transporter receptor subunit TctC
MGEQMKRSDLNSRKLSRRVVVGGSIALGMSAPWPRVAAQSTYPDKPIKLIVPFPAGGGGDILARTVTDKVATVLGQPFIVENRAGAGGNIGSAAAAKMEADGYNVLYGTNGTLAINHALYKTSGFDPLTEFEPVARLTEIGLVVVTHPSVPATTLKELVDYSKANPGQLKVATAGNGTTSHLASEMFKRAAGVDWLTIHFRGGAPAMTDLVAGHVNVMIEIMASALPQVTSKTLKGLAVTTSSRWPSAPELPTTTEAGINGMTVTAWDALLVPKGTPQAVIDRLNAAVAKAFEDKSLEASLLTRGAKPVGGPPAALKSFMASEFTRWGDVVRASGAKVE